MKDAKLQQVILSDNVGLYSISFNGDLTEYRKFVEKFKDDAKLNKDYRSILTALLPTVHLSAISDRKAK